MPETYRLDPAHAVDLARYEAGEERERAAVIEAARRALRETGFLVLVEHGVDPALLERGYEALRAFFALPAATKAAHAKGDGAVGYIAGGVEQALRARVPDLKELWHHAHGGPNRAVPEVAGFDATLAALDVALARCLGPVMRLLSEVVEMPPAFLDDVARGAPHMLRLVHYPRVPSGALGMRAFEHTGAGLLGLLPRPSAPGLQLKRPDGVWVEPVGLDDRHVVVTIADQIERLTNRLVPGSVHRVVNRPGVRDAIVYFAAAHPETRLWPPAELLARGGTPTFAPMTSEQFTVRRLRRIWRNEGSFAYRVMSRIDEALRGSDVNR